MRYFIELAYHGSNYHGWQVQPDALSVQEVLEDRLGTLLRSAIKIVGAGRTDTGVHATQMFAHFDSANELDCADLCFRLNSFLPADIAIKDIFRAKDEAHVRFDAVSRSYQYHLVFKKDQFLADRSWLLHHTPDMESMNRAAAGLLGRQDFQCFSRSNTDVKTYYCEVKQAVWKTTGDQMVFSIMADRFLRNMVRAVVGTLVEIGLGRRSVESLSELIQSRDRSMAGPSAPAHGLFLTGVCYPDAIKY